MQKNWLSTCVVILIGALAMNVAQAQEEPPEPEFMLEITVREDAIEVGERSAGLLSRIDNTDTSYDLPALSEYLRSVKGQFPDKADATLLLEPDIEYETLVAVMDTVRVAEMMNDAGSEVVRYELFPEISIGDAPRLN